MTKINLGRLSVAELVEQFVANRIAQDEAELNRQTRLFRRLYDEMTAILEELRGRPGDERRALLPLLQHPNFEVMLNAAVATLTIDPEASRRTLQALRNSHWYPQAAEAGMTLNALDNGTYKPT